MNGRVRPTSLRIKSHSLYVLLILIMLGGTALRLYDLDGKSLRGDERVTQVKSQSLDSILKSTPTRPSWSRQPVLYLATFASLLIGQGDFWVRLPVALTGILSIAALYRLGQRFFGPLEGAISAALLAFSPVHLWYSQDARKYSVLILLVLLTLLALERALHTGSTRAWLGFGTGSILSLTTHSLASLVVLVEGVWAGMIMLTQERKAPHRWKNWLFLGLCALVIGLLFLPQQVGILKTTALGNPIAENEADSARVVRYSQAQWTGDVFGQAFWEFANENWIVLSLSLGLAGLALVEALSWRKDIVLLTVLWVGLPAGVLFWFQPHHSPATRYLCFWLPIFLMWIGRGVVVLVRRTGDLLARSGKQGVQPWPMIGLAIITLGLVFSGRTELGDYYAQEKQDWRGAAKIVSSGVQPGEVVVVSEKRAAQSLAAYAPDMANIQLVSTQAELEALLDEYAGLWLVRWWSAAETHTPILSVWLNDQAFVRLSLEGSWSPLQIWYRRQGNTASESMVRLGEIAVALYPQQVDFHIALGDAYREEERWQSAIAEYHEALALEPSLVRAYVGLGLTWQAQGQFQEALGAFQQAAALEPDSEQIYRLLGDTFRAIDQPNEAIAAYERALTLNQALTDKAWFCMRLGRAYYEAQQWASAADMFERVLQLEPDNVPAQQYLRKVRP